MAMHPDRPILAAVRMGGGSPPHVDILDVGGGSLKRLLQLPRASADLVSCITCLPGSDLFAVGASRGRRSSPAMNLQNL